MKKFLAKPTRVPLSLLVINLGLTVTVMVLAVVHLHSAATAPNFPWSSLFIAAICLLLLGMMAAMRSFEWMSRNHPDRMHQVNMDRRQAIRQADGALRKWRATLRHMPLPLVVVALGWLFAGVLASGVGLMATGVLH